MQHDEFIGQVQHRARLASRGDAERAVRATLESLAERLSDGMAANLAAQLPHEVGEHLRRKVSVATGAGERFTLDDFFHRVSEEEGVAVPQAVFHARVVLEVVEEATTGGLFAKLRQQLPGEWDRLFQAPS
jgi:uncharacterized protein (DUF2267 family)